MKYEELKDALDGLHAYDGGCLDSGIHDEGLRARVKEYLQKLPETERRAVIAKMLIDMYLGPEALAGGYGPEDAKDFLEWLEGDMECLA